MRYLGIGIISKKNKLKRKQLFTTFLIKLNPFLPVINAKLSHFCVFSFFVDNCFMRGVEHVKTLITLEEVTN